MNIFILPSIIGKAKQSIWTQFGQKKTKKIENNNFILLPTLFLLYLLHFTKKISSYVSKKIEIIFSFVLDLDC